MPDLKAHVFVCTNVKEGRVTCGPKGAAELRDNLKKLAKEKWQDDVRINNAGCLGKCEDGIACVIYPKGEWLTHLNGTDVDKVFSAIDTILKNA